MECRKCKHKASIPGDAHLSCQHPIAKKEKNPMGEVMGIFASVGRVPPGIEMKAAAELGIVINAHGFASGWANWPYNFDPVWIDSCKGYEEPNES